jgi:outer membrane protein assembly factor BamD
VTGNGFARVSRHVGRIFGMSLLVAALAGCTGMNLFGPPKLREEAIVPEQTLYQEALNNMDRQRYLTAIELLERMERQHPRGQLAEEAKLMLVFANYRIGKFSDAILAADRYLALYPNGRDADYVYYLKGSSQYLQIVDITRDQQIAQDSIETYTALVQTYPNSRYADEARDRIRIARDNLAGKEMSVGRYYLGQGQYTAGINRFRMVVEQYQTSSHIEEALYRLTEGYLALGLTSEARTAAAVLGHNYPSSTWYRSAFELLGRQGLTPEINTGSWLAGQRRT